MRMLASAILITVLGWPQPTGAQQGGRVEEVDAIFAQWDREDSPGCALGIIQDGAFVYRRGYGMASLELAVPISSKSVFYIGSTSKQFVSASIMLAAEQGRLSLDDDIRTYLPEVPDYGNTITIRHLLHHTSGLRDYLTLWDLAGERIEDIHSAEEALEMIARQKAPNFDPGDEYLYSNSGYFLLSVIVKRATGHSLREYAQQNIFQPLGMEHTHFHDDYTHIVKNRAIGHLLRGDGTVALNMSNFAQVGSGGIYSSVDDLLLWDRNYYDNELGNGGLIERMQVRGALNNGDTLNYAAALLIDEYRGLRTVSHGGALGGYRADFLRFPDQRFSVICLCNLASITPSSLAYQVADVYLADQFPESLQTQVAEEEVGARGPADFVTLPPAELEPLAGMYRAQSTGMIIEVSTTDGGLRIEGPDFTYHFSPLSSSQFVATDAPVGIELRFEHQTGGNPTLVRAMVQGQPPLTLELIERFEPDASALAEYAGVYFSEELDTGWELIVKEGALFRVRRPNTPLEPEAQDQFTLGNVTLRFVRSADGEVTSFAVDAGRVRGIEFVRANR